MKKRNIKKYIINNVLEAARIFAGCVAVFSACLALILLSDLDQTAGTVFGIVLLVGNVGILASFWSELKAEMKREEIMKRAAKRRQNI